jgi:hypothetical protein
MGVSAKKADFTGFAELPRLIDTLTGGSVAGAEIGQNFAPSLCGLRWHQAEINHATQIDAEIFRGGQSFRTVGEFGGGHLHGAGHGNQDAVGGSRDLQYVEFREGGPVSADHGVIRRPDGGTPEVANDNAVVPDGTVHRAEKLPCRQVLLACSMNFRPSMT